MPPGKGIELLLNLLATFLSTFLPTPWIRIVIDVLVAALALILCRVALRRFQSKYAGLISVFVPLLIGVLGYFVPQQPRPDAVTAQATVIENSGGGTGADISVSGTPGARTPNVGLSTNGLRVIQNGTGTGMKLTVGGNGPVIGVRSIVTNGEIDTR
jgi:hypothetical protein